MKTRNKSELYQDEHGTCIDYHWFMPCHRFSIVFAVMKILRWNNKSKILPLCIHCNLGACVIASILHTHGSCHDGIGRAWRSSRNWRRFAQFSCHKQDPTHQDATGNPKIGSGKYVPMKHVPILGFMLKLHFEVIYRVHYLPLYLGGT